MSQFLRRKAHSSQYIYLPVQLDPCLLLHLSPQLVGFLHHPYVEVLLVGFADNTSLAMGATSGMGKDKLEEKDVEVWIRNNYPCAPRPRFLVDPLSQQFLLFMNWLIEKKNLLVFYPSIVALKPGNTTPVKIIFHGFKRIYTAGELRINRRF